MGDKVRGYYKGGETTKTPKTIPQFGSANPNQKLEQLMETMINKLDAMPTRIKAYLVDSELEEFREKRDMLKEVCEVGSNGKDHLQKKKYFENI